MTTETLIAIVLVLVLSALALLLWFWKTSTDDRKHKDGKSDSDFDEISDGTDCPLCGEHLPRGTRVHSVIYPGKEFDLMRIYGCPHCFAGHSAPAPDHELHQRRCPYCRNEIPENGYVMAQVYRKAYRRTHVHVYGCTVCSPGRG